VAVPQSIAIAVVCADLEEGLFRAIPLIDNFDDQVLMVVELKAHGPLVRFAAGIALYPDGHLLSP
jgi:hypothetical protein